MKWISDLTDLEDRTTSHCQQLDRMEVHLGLVPMGPPNTVLVEGSLWKSRRETLRARVDWVDVRIMRLEKKIADEQEDTGIPVAHNHGWSLRGCSECDNDEL